VKSLWLMHASASAAAPERVLTATLQIENPRANARSQSATFVWRGVLRRRRARIGAAAVSGRAPRDPREGQRRDAGGRRRRPPGAPAHGSDSLAAPFRGTARAHSALPRGTEPRVKPEKAAWHSCTRSRLTTGPRGLRRATTSDLSLPMPLHRLSSSEACAKSAVCHVQCGGAPAREWLWWRGHVTGRRCRRDALDSVARSAAKLRTITSDANSPPH